MKIGDRIREDAVGAWHRVQDAPLPGTLRILRAEHAGQEAPRLVFLEELRRIKTLDHPALIRVLHHDSSGDRPWMLTEPIDGESLADHLAEAGPLTEAEALALAERFLDAFDFLAERRQVHAAPLPERIVRVRADWKLLTFRDIRAWDELKTLKGKKHPQPAFAPPERAKAHPAAYGPRRHNAWHVGALLRFALGGGPPQDEAGRPAAPAQPFSAQVAGMLDRLLAADPDRRAADAAATRRVLRGEEAGPPPAAAAGRPPPRQAPVPRRKRRRGR